MKRLASLRASCGSWEHLLTPRVVLLLFGGLRGVLLGTLSARQVDRRPTGVIGMVAAADATRWLAEGEKRGVKGGLAGRSGVPKLTVEADWFVDEEWSGGRVSANGLKMRKGRKSLSDLGLHLVYLVTTP